VKDGAIYTPPLSASILPGITRDMIVQIAHDLGYRVKPGKHPARDALHRDEVFLRGTAVEITPVRSVDKITVGTGPPRADYRGDSAPVPRRDQRRRPGSAQVADISRPRSSLSTAGCRRVDQSPLIKERGSRRSLIKAPAHADKGRETFCPYPYESRRSASAVRSVEVRPTFT